MSIRVVVEFEDDNEAKKFVKATLLNKVCYEELVPASDGYLSVVFQRMVATVTAVYKKPTKFCEPEDGHRSTKRTTGWTRGRKYGWWVCAVCGKPTKRWATGDIWHFSMGYNLLPPEVSPLDRGVRSTVEWKAEDLGIRHEPGPLQDEGLPGDVQEPRVGEDPSA